MKKIFEVIHAHSSRLFPTYENIVSNCGDFMESPQCVDIVEILCYNVILDYQMVISSD